MNQKHLITHHQFMLLTMIFCTGSAILFIPSIMAATAQRDGWIATIVGTIFALFLIWMYSHLTLSFKGSNLVQMYDLTFGKLLGKFLTFQFTVYLILLSALILRGLGDFLTTQILDTTPIEVILLVLLLVIVHGHIHGLQVIGRSIEVLIPTILILYSMGIFLITKESKLIQLLPVMENGIKPILNGAFSIFNFPFTEVVILLMFVHKVKKIEGIKKPFLFGTLLGGVSLFFPVFFGIVTLGPDQLANQLYSTYTLAKMLGISKVFERIEVILAIIWLLSIYFKLLLCYSALVHSVEHLFQLKNTRSILLPLAWVLFGVTLLIADTNVYFFHFNANIWPLYAFTIGFVLPLLMYVITVFKKRKKKS